jgi:diguanylate cyclase (GGDEF)-like protein
LHDIGMIAVPDHILLKAESLTREEAEIIQRSRKKSMEILRRGCSSERILEIVEHVSAWYDGDGQRKLPFGKSIPLGARMIAIVEAFDAMTTDHIYRPARSQERAMAELFECAGTQFDPELVPLFAEFHGNDLATIRWESAHRWLRSLEPNLINSHWEPSNLPSAKEDRTAEGLFQDRLLENMYDAVVFIDAAGRVVLWNRGTERLTGIAGVSVCGEMWHPDLLGLSDEKGSRIIEDECPVFTAIRCSVQSLRRLTILGRGQQAVSVDAHVIPVMNERGISQGTILMLHDASSETSLEQRCQNLHDKATKDPLTQVSNRAEFDRVHAMFVAAHQQQRVPCSLLICDLDRFKLVNDTFGHQAGDDVIKCMASLLKRSCRPGDLVARYGGEEFVLLCADCDNATAFRRAEEIRKALSEVPQPKMEGRVATVSFGVTEIQPGDTAETMLRRADRALLMAKSNGRNCVVQLGVGSEEETPPEAPVEASPASRLFSNTKTKAILEQDLITPVPLKIAIAKLRGFVADHDAKIVAVEGNRMRLEIEDKSLSRLRRLADRSTAFVVDLVFEEERLQKITPDENGSPGVGVTRTKIKITISSRKARERRHEEIMAKASSVLVSFRSYLIATQENVKPSGALTIAKLLLTPWLIK